MEKGKESLLKGVKPSLFGAAFVIALGSTAAVLFQLWPWAIVGFALAAGMTAWQWSSDQLAKHYSKLGGDS